MESNQLRQETGGVASVISRENFLQVGPLNIYLKTSSRAKLSVEKRNGFTLVHFDISHQTGGAYEIVVESPFIGIEKSWVGQVQTWTGSDFVSVALNFAYETAANRFIPVICDYALSGENRLLAGLADHKPLTRVSQQVLIEHPMRNLRLTFSRERPRGSFRETLILGLQKKPWSEIVQEYFKLCKKLSHIEVLSAPAWAHEPVWCSWYAYVTEHKQRDIENELPALREAGIRTVLIDAVWFGPYDFSDERWLFNRMGDFEPNLKEWPDMKGLVEKIHRAGMKAILWCAPLWVGPQSKAWKQMGKFCVLDGKKRLGRLCPNCPESIDHARKIVGRLMRDFDLDGLKIDFMDHVEPRCSDPHHNHSQNDFGEAMDCFMAEIREEIREINPQAVIEYRVRYSNLVTLAHANAQRGNDSPYDADYIRRQNVYLRMFGDKRQAVWSDYLYWHPDESLENISLRIGQMIFSGGVPTYSIRYSAASPKHKQITKQWNQFYLEHKDNLRRAKLQIHSADSAYSVLSLQDVKSGAAYVYLSGPFLPLEVSISPSLQNVWVLNAAAQKRGKIRIGAKTLSISRNGLFSLKLS